MFWVELRKRAALQRLHSCGARATPCIFPPRVSCRIGSALQIESAFVYKQKIRALHDRIANCPSPAVQILLNANVFYFLRVKHSYGECIVFIHLLTGICMPLHGVRDQLTGWTKEASLGWTRDHCDGRVGNIYLCGK